jgi:hypothetical protein
MGCVQSNFHIGTNNFHRARQRGWGREITYGWH